MTTAKRYEVPTRDVTVTEEQRNGCTVRTVHEDGAFLCYVLFGPDGWRVGEYKTERGLTRAITRATSAVTSTTDSDLILKWVDQHDTGKYSGCGRGKCKTHPGLPINHIPLAMAPALRALIADGTLRVIEVTKPRPTDPTRTITYDYVSR